jgi:hypothetical protein
MLAGSRYAAAAVSTACFRFACVQSVESNFTLPAVAAIALPKLMLRHARGSDVTIYAVIREHV